MCSVSNNKEILAIQNVRAKWVMTHSLTELRYVPKQHFMQVRIYNLTFLHTKPQQCIARRQRERERE